MSRQQSLLWEQQWDLASSKSTSRTAPSSSVFRPTAGGQHSQTCALSADAPHTSRALPPHTSWYSTLRKEGSLPLRSNIDSRRSNICVVHTRAGSSSPRSVHCRHPSPFSWAGASTPPSSHSPQHPCPESWETG